MNKISNNNSIVKNFVELFTANDDFVESEKTDIYFEPKRNNILVNLAGFRDAELALCEFKVKVETVNHKNIVSFIFDKDSKGEDPDNLEINNKSVLKTYKELDSLFYGAFENRKFEFTFNDLEVIKDLSNNESLDIIELLDDNKVSDKLKSDLKSYIDSVNKCISYADKNYDKLMSVFNDMSMEK